MKTLEWLRRLIAIDTTSRLSNLKLIEEIQSWCEQHHLTTQLTRDPQEPKANLFATIPASDGSITNGIVFSGHTDVVPVDGQHWETDPFAMQVINDRVYGRGTCDMKGFIAAVLAHIPYWQQMKLDMPIHLAFSYDEEIGCRGAPRMISDFVAKGIKPSACIVGEPTDMQPVIAHKGIQLIRCKVDGVAAHSSLTTEGCNAIEYAAELITYLRSLAKSYQKGLRDADYDVPFTTMTTNLIHGGNACNTIPATCEFVFEFRYLPAIDPEKIYHDIQQYVDKTLLPKMRLEQQQANIQFETVATAPSFEIKQEAMLVKIVSQVTKVRAIKKVAYATEAGLFQQANIPTIVCGPGCIEEAHKANEYVTLAQLYQCETFLKEIVTRYR